MRKHKETFKTITFITIAVLGLGYFGFSLYRENNAKQVQQVVKSKDIKKTNELSTPTITTSKVKEWGDLVFYFVEKGLALTATGAGIYLTIKQKNNSKKA